MISRNMSRQLLRLALSTGPFLLVSTGSAQSTWNGEVDSNWATPGNWSPEGVPGTGDDVIFGDTGAGTVALNGEIVVASIAIGSDYTFTGSATNFIGGATSISKSGSGLVTLGGTNTFTGGISITGGTLRPTGSQALGANGSVVTIGNGATFDVFGQMTANRNYHARISGVGVGGNGAIVNSGAENINSFGRLSLDASASIGGTARWDVRGASGAFSGLLDLGGHTLTKIGGNKIGIVDAVVTSAGSINVNSGTLAFTRSNVSGEGSVNVNSGAILQLENYTSGTFDKAIALNGGRLQVTGNAFTLGSNIALTGAAEIETGVNLTVPGAVDGAGSLTKIGGSSLILTGDATHSGGTTVSTGTLQIGSGGTSGSISGNIVNNATVNFNRSDDHAYGGAISGSGALVKQGAGILTLSGVNIYGGATTINGGGLRLEGGANRLPTATSVTFANTAGVNLDLNGLNQQVRSLSGGGASGGNIVNTGAALSVLRVRPEGSDTTTFSGQISGDIRLEILGEKTAPAAGNPRLRLAGTNNAFTGGLLIDGGTLLARQDGSLGAVPVAFQADNIILRNNGTLLNEADGNALTLHQNRGITLETGGGALVAGFNTNVTVQGVISGAAGNHLTILPNNQTVIFTGNNTYAGNTILSAATSRLQIGNGGTSGTLGAGDVINNGLLTFNRSDDVTIAHTISGTGSVTKSGSGTLTLSGNNSYEGVTRIVNGVLAAASNGVFGSSQLRFDGGTISSSDATPREFTTGKALDFALPSTFGTVGTGDLKFNDDVNLGNALKTATVAAGVTVEFAGALSGGTTNPFTKAGDGVLVLSGNSSGYTRTSTVVSAGTLLVTGQLGGTGTVSIEAGATLGGDGTITGTVATVGATSVISPGTSPGAITMGALNVTNGATFAFELGVDSDRIVIDGSLIAGGPLTFHFANAGGISAETAYTLFEFDSQTGLDLDDLVAATLPDGFVLDLSFGTGGWLINSGSLQVQFIPEPSTAVLGGLGLVLVFRRRRDR